MVDSFSMINLFNLFKDSFKAPEIPKRDKIILVAIIILVISPLDFIPDFLLPFGVFDDIVLISIFFDYFCNHIERDLLLKYWRGSLKGFNFYYRIGKILSGISPKKFVRKLWLYKPNPY